MASPSTLFHADSLNRVSQIMVEKGDPAHILTSHSLFWEITDDQYDEQTKTETTVVARTMLHKEQVIELAKALEEWLESLKNINS